MDIETIGEVRALSRAARRPGQLAASDPPQAINAAWDVVMSAHTLAIEIEAASPAFAEALNKLANAVKEQMPLLLQSGPEANPHPLFATLSILTAACTYYLKDPTQLAAFNVRLDERIASAAEAEPPAVP